MIKELIAAALGTVAFSLLFGVPSKFYVDCGVIGAAGWLVYSACQALHAGESLAVFLAAVAVVLLSRAFAVRRKCPSTVFMITGIFPLVPGAQFYWASYYLVTDQFQDALSSGFGALKAMIAIVLGIIVVFEIPHRVFAVRKAR